MAVRTLGENPRSDVAKAKLQEEHNRAKSQHRQMVKTTAQPCSVAGR